jgi:hypothetical protein
MLDHFRKYWKLFLVLELELGETLRASRRGACMGWYQIVAGLGD